MRGDKEENFQQQDILCDRCGQDNYDISVYQGSRELLLCSPCYEKYMAQDLTEEEE